MGGIRLYYPILPRHTLCIIIIVYGLRSTEAEIQIQLKQLPDSSISSLILAGWQQEGHPVKKTLDYP